MCLCFSCIAPPNVTIQDNSYIIVNESSSYQLLCEVSSLPVSTVSWYFNGSTLLNDTTNTKISSADTTLDNGLVIRTSVLTINNISKELEGDYSCRGNNGVDNIIGTREHDTVFIFVQGIPVYNAFVYADYLVPPLVLINGESEVIALIGSNLTLSFFITNASPSVTIDNIYWTVNGNTFLPSDRFIFSGDLLNVIIVDVELYDEGYYTITVSNPAGIYSVTILVDVECESL